METDAVHTGPGAHYGDRQPLRKTMKYIIAVGLPVEKNIPYEEIRKAICAGVDKANEMIKPLGACAYYPDEIRITLLREPHIEIVKQNHEDKTPETKGGK